MAAGYGTPGAGERDNISQLILHGGNAQAQAAAHKGEMWGNLLSGVGQQLGGAIQQYGQQKERAKRDDFWVSYVESGEWAKDPKQALAMSLRTWGPEDGPKQFQALQATATLMGEKRDPEADRKGLGVIVGAMGRLKTDAARARLFPQALALAKRVYPNIQISDQYDPAAWPEIEAIGAELRGEKPPGTRQITVRNPDGSETVQIVEDKPGFTATSAAEPRKPPTLGSMEDYMTADPARRAEIEKARKGYMQADDRPKAAEPEKAAERQRLLEAVVANPQLWDDLTPTVKGDLAGDLNKRGFSGFGKGLPEKAVAKISEGKSAVDSLRDLRGVLQANEQYIGPVAGLQALNPWSDARKAQSDIDRVRQRVGKALEGGVLRKEDEVKYKKILSTLTDEPATAIYKIDQMIRNLENDIANYIEEQRLAGRRVNTGVPNRAGPKLGDRKTFPNGRVGIWDGKGWAAQ